MTIESNQGIMRYYISIFMMGWALFLASSLIGAFMGQGTLPAVANDYLARDYAPDHTPDHTNVTHSAYFPNINGGVELSVATKKYRSKSKWSGQNAEILYLPNSASHVFSFFDWVDKNKKSSSASLSHLKTSLTLNDNLIAARLEAPKYIGISPVFVHRFPSDFYEGISSAQRKALFAKIMLPLILRENDRILFHREKLNKIFEKKRWSQRDRDYVAFMADQYKVKIPDADPGTGRLSVFDDQDLRNDIAGQLQRKVDVIPPGLALSQAANESGWGGSRFVKLGNALFGEWTWSSNDKGIVPLRRGAGQTHRIKAFDDLASSVQSYMRNVNTNRPYKLLRDKRHDMRQKGAVLNSYELAAGLINYSSKKDLYVTHIRQLLQRNHFAKFDYAYLVDYVRL